jgi:hypothetical protein
MIGKVLAQYQISEKLGEGGVGVVWKALRPAVVLLPVQCCIKLLFLKIDVGQVTRGRQETATDNA